MKWLCNTFKQYNEIIMKKIILCILVVGILAACDSPEPKKYSELPEPLPESEGELLFLESKCPVCHGYQGAGNGFLSAGLKPQPLDFSSAEVMAEISDPQLQAAIRNGKSSAMPAYAQFTDGQLAELTRYIRSLSK